MSNSIFYSYLVGLYYTKFKARLSKNKSVARKRQFMYEKDFIDLSESHQKIRQMILDDEPAMVARYGLTEAQVVGKYFLKKRIGGGYGACGNWLYNTAGFFSKDGKRLEKDLDRFSELMIESSKQVDLIGASYCFLEDYVINKCCPDSQITEFNNLRVMAYSNSWASALEGKKVLVIHPFAKSIEQQYEKREHIWKNPTILPKFELITYKAIQTIGGVNTDLYDDWFAALDVMTSDIEKIDFDVAIIGCGAYGFPLAAHCKLLGKKAIHLGGQVQMMFGILGERWEKIPFYKEFINDYWVHPLPEETPDNFKKIENGCYW